MYVKRIQIDEGKCLTLVEMASNGSVAAQDRADVLIRLPDGQEDLLTITETEAGPELSVRAGCEIEVPDSLPVKVRAVKGNFQVTGVAKLDAEQVRGNLKLGDVKEANLAEVFGNLRAENMSCLSMAGTVFGDAVLKGIAVADLQNVRGDLRIQGIDRLRTSRIGGNLQAKEIGGKLAIDQVGGNAVLKDVAGFASLDQVAGNLAAKNLYGGAKVPKVGGNLALNGEIGTGCTYHFVARGNASLRLPQEASAHVILTAKGRILSSVALVDQSREGNRLAGTLGDGGSEIVVEAGGNIMLGGGKSDMGVELADEISRQVEESLRAVDLEAIGRQVSDEMEAALSRLQFKLESVDWERIGMQSQQAVERAMEQMRRNMDRMVEKAARHQERLERRIEREGWRQDTRAAEGEHSASVEVEDWQAGQPDGPPAPAPGLDEERLSILRMVEQGQISPEEAEMLLDALQQ
jgi:hypothetical protein